MAFADVLKDIFSDWRYLALGGAALVILAMLIVLLCCCCCSCCKAQEKRKYLRLTKEKQLELRKLNQNIFEEKKSDLFRYVDDPSLSFAPSSSFSSPSSPSSSSSTSSSSFSSKLSFDQMYRTSIQTRPINIHEHGPNSGTCVMTTTICMSTSTTSFYSVSPPHAQQTAPFSDSLNCYLLHLSSHYVTFQNNVAVPRQGVQPQEFFVFPLLKDVIKGIKSIHEKYPSQPVLDMLSPHSVVISPGYELLLPVYIPRRAIAGTSHGSFVSPTFLSLLSEYTIGAVNMPGNGSIMEQGQQNYNALSIDNALIDNGCTLVVGGYETLRYCAPECLEGTPPSVPSLVYNLCMILYSYITGQAPFTALPIQTCVTTILQNGRPSLDILNGSPFQPFFSRCWARQPKDRPSLDELYSVLERMENEF